VNQPSQDPYNFFMEPPKPAKKSPFSPGKLSGSSRLLAHIAGGGLVLIVIIVLFSALFGGKDTASPLVAIVSDQQELVRVAGIGVDDAT
ncbi:hypothetical protein RCL06_24370, partial [Salmonella enterica subsp. enterica serovar Typhimurium]